MEFEHHTKACVILGAGASHDVHGDGSKLINSDWQPPLASQLFHISDNPAYDYVLGHYPGAAFLAQELAEHIPSGEVGIEQLLRDYSDKGNSQIRRHFKDIPPYLHDLLYRASTEYTHWPSSYIRLVKTLLADSNHHVLFISLNYDDLLEKALIQYDPETYIFKHISQYQAQNRLGKVVKLHGSVSWFQRLGQGASWEQLVSSLEVSDKLPDGEFIIVDDISIVKGYSHKGSYLYPLVTAPLANKKLDEVVCPNSHVAIASEFLADCKKFLIVGTSGLDLDLMELLNRSVGQGGSPYLHIVGPNKKWGTR